MKKKFVALVGIAVGLLAIAPWSFAGDYHTGIGLICSDCHTMHFSQQHGYDPSVAGGGNFTQLGTGPNELLLRNDINDLCLSCHNGQSWAPDVLESHGNGYVRQAGALNQLGGSGLYPELTGHTLGSTDIAPGSNPAWSDPDGLACTDCHAAHGRAQSGTPSNGGYRNLYGPNGVSLSYSRGDVEGTNDLTRWVFEDNSSGASDAHYGRGHLTFNEPDATKSKYADFCKQCHTDFHGDVGGVEVGGIGTPPIDFHRHPASTVNIGAAGSGHSVLSRFVAEGANQTQVMSPTGVRAGSYTAANTDLSPSCFSCHKGHGNQNAFGLVYMLGSGTIDEEGDAGTDMRNTCRACHSMGGTGAW